MGGQSYGLPLRCLSCATRWLVPGLKPGTWFSVFEQSRFCLLKIPGVKAAPCPSCGARLTATRKVGEP